MRRGTFVVQALELGSQTCGDQAGMKDLKGGEDAGACATAHGLHKNAIAVVVIDYQYIIVTNAGRHDKLAGLIRMDLAGGWFKHGGITLMCACIVRFTGGERFIFK